MPHELSASNIVAQISARICRHLTRLAIADLQRMTDSLLSGEDSGLENTWDEICVQIQSEQSVFWQTYDDIVRSLVADLVQKLLPFEREAIWLQTDQGVSWDCDEPGDRPVDPVSNDDIAEYVLTEFVYSAASNWTNVRIQAYLDQASRSD
jgi:hypothetical protein